MVLAPPVRAETRLTERVGVAPLRELDRVVVTERVVHPLHPLVPLAARGGGTRVVVHGTHVHHVGEAGVGELLPVVTAGVRQPDVVHRRTQDDDMVELGPGADRVVDPPLDLHARLDPAVALVRLVDALDPADDVGVLVGHVRDLLLDLRLGRLHRRHGRVPPDQLLPGTRDRLVEVGELRLVHRPHLRHGHLAVPVQDRRLVLVDVRLEVHVLAHAVPLVHDLRRQRQHQLRAAVPGQVQAQRAGTDGHRRGDDRPPAPGPPGVVLRDVVHRASPLALVSRLLQASRHGMGPVDHVGVPGLLPRAATPSSIQPTPRITNSMASGGSQTSRASAWNP